MLIKNKEISINLNLAKEKKLNKKDILRLINTYKKLFETIELANKDKKLKTPGSGFEYATKIENLEFALQDLWKFPKDNTKHRYWNTLNSCNCPKNDNILSLSLNRIVNLDCIFHGNKPELKNSLNLNI